MLCLKMICHRRFGKWICNGILLIVAVAFLGLCLLNFVNPLLPAIRCKGTTVVDEQILHKYGGETVRLSYLLVVVFLVPFIQICVTEVLHVHYLQCQSCQGPLEPNPWRIGLRLGAQWFRDYFYGMTFLVLFNDICKSTMNYPRPHFVDSCKPNFTESACVNGWVEDYKCDNPNVTRWKLVEAHKSFPSAHAAMGMFAATFMIIYQHHRLTVKRHGAILILWCHLAWLSWGVFCSMSRISDYRHHAVDVVAGGIFGICGALFTTRFLSRNFRNPHQLDIYEENGGYPTPRNRSTNGSATFVEGFPSQPNMPSSISMPAELNGGVSKGPSRVLANTPQRPSLRRLLSSQSTLTQMSDIREDRELEPI